MSDPHSSADPTSDGPSNRPPFGATAVPDPAGSLPSLSPGAARRRLAAELRALRTSTNRALKDVGDAIERSSATISRYENAQYIPRTLEVVALLDYFRRLAPDLVTNEVRERIILLTTESRKVQWFEPFKDSATGDILPDHLINFVEYETDANEVRTYEPNLVPGLLQTRPYARAVAHAFFPNRPAAEHDQFIEFRMVRQVRLGERGDGVRLSFVVNEVALRRDMGTPDVRAEQLLALAGHVRNADGPIDLRIVPMSAAFPAALRGPFVVLSFPLDVQQTDVAYLESSSGGDYLTDPSAVSRFHGYYENLLAATLAPAEALRLIESLATQLGSRKDPD